MRINFRQGIIGAQTGGFLNINPSGNVDILAQNRPCQVTLAQDTSNYTHSEDNNVDDAWLGPFSAAVNYWLYWDFNLLTFERTFGYTILEPVAQSVPPGNGNAPITGTIAGGPGVGTFIVPEFYALQVGRPFDVSGSDGNDGSYTVVSTSFNEFTGETSIVVNQTVVAFVGSGSPSTDGEVNLDFDAYGEALLQTGRHWYDTTNNRHFVWTGTAWSERLRVFSAQLTNGNTFIPQTITGGSFIGTQIGDTSSVTTGRPMFDELNLPIIRDNRTFLTTEDQMFAGASRVDGVRLESNVARALFPFDGAIAAYTVVAWKADGKAQTALYDDTGTTVVGMLTEDVVVNETGAVVIQGVVENVNWDWSSIPIGSDLWVDNGLLTPNDPHVVSVVTYPIGRVPVARVLSKTSVVFEQGLGGKGDTGPPGSVEDLPAATTTELGGVTLTTPSSIPELAIVPSDLDPRLSDARTPLAHTHIATDVNFTPGAGITSNNVQGALLELGDGKVDVSGDTMTGFLTLNANPTAALHAAPKQYVDALVSGFVWLEPIALLDLISDTETTPPGSPINGDAYIIPPGATGAWAAISVGNIVQWHASDSSWHDHGPLVNQSVTRFGVSFTNATTAAGSFVGQDNNIAIYDGTGTLTGFEVPVANNAVFVTVDDAINQFDQYVYNGTDWIQFGGASANTGDDMTIVLNGNVLSTKQFDDGGIVDAKFWQNLQPSDLALIYAPISHGHAATEITFTAYTTSPDWGTLSTPADAHTVAATVQAAIEELTDKKALKAPHYAALANFPAAGTVTGMIAYAQAEGSMYFSHGGSWVEVASNDGTTQDHDHVLPYDMTFFVSGTAASTSSTLLGMYTATRNISVDGGTPNLFGYANVAPSGASVTFDIVKNGNTGSPVGTVTFADGSNVPNSTGVNGVTFTLVPGDRLELISPVVTELNISDVSISIIGCSNLGDCPTT